MSKIEEITDDAPVNQPTVEEAGSDSEDSHAGHDDSGSRAQVPSTPDVVV